MVHACDVANASAVALSTCRSDARYDYRKQYKHLRAKACQSYGFGKSIFAPQAYTVAEEHYSRSAYPSGPRTVRGMLHRSEKMAAQREDCQCGQRGAELQFMQLFVLCLITLSFAIMKTSPASSFHALKPSTRNLAKPVQPRLARIHHVQKRYPRRNHHSSLTRKDP